MEIGYFFSQRRIASFFCLWTITLLLFRQPALAQGFNQVPDEVEYRALRDLYNSTHGILWTNQTNWLRGASHTSFASWHGVVVVNGDVSRLHLANNNLSGPLPASLD